MPILKRKHLETQPFYPFNSTSRPSIEFKIKVHTGIEKWIWQKYDVKFVEKQHTGIQKITVLFYKSHSFMLRFVKLSNNSA